MDKLEKYLDRLIRINELMGIYEDEQEFLNNGECDADFESISTLSSDKAVHLDEKFIEHAKKVEESKKLEPEIEELWKLILDGIVLTKKTKLFSRIALDIEFRSNNEFVMDKAKKLINKMKKEKLTKTYKGLMPFLTELVTYKFVSSFIRVSMQFDKYLETFVNYYGKINLNHKNMKLLLYYIFLRREGMELLSSHKEKTFYEKEIIINSKYEKYVKNHPFLPKKINSDGCLYV